ncbi:MAG: TolC family protein [Longimicrobiales bacterium]|nr:TolC family protein [Longimicrobiales bacterium]
MKRTTRTLAVALAFVAPGTGGAQTLTLSEAAARGLDVHPALARAVAAADAAGAGVRQAAATRYPQLALQGSGTRYQEPMLVAPLHRFDPSRVPDFDETLLQSALSAEWTLFDGGRRGAEGAAAQARSAASAEVVRETEAAVLQRVADAYLAALTAREWVAALQRHRRALEAERDRATRLVEEGAAPELERLRAESELAEAHAEGESGRHSLELALTTLAELLDLPREDFEPDALVSPDLPSDPTPPDEVDTLRIAAAPSVQVARSGVAEAEAALDRARAAWLPTFSAVGGYTILGGASVSPIAEWRGGLQLSYPLFTGGARRSAVDGSRASLREANARVAEASEEVTLAAARARTAEAEARARLAALTAAVDRFVELARVERLALDEGAGMQSDWLRAEAGLLRARAGLAEARHRVLSARIAWARATGRLTLEWIDQLLEVGE